MRKNFISEIIKEVYGPREGAEEIIRENPANEYLTGVLIPKPKVKSEISSPDEEQIKDNSISSSEDYEFNEDISEFYPSELNPSLRTRSFGLSFTAESSISTFDICITWARYFRDMDSQNNEFWKRKPFFKIFRGISITSQDLIVDKNDSGETLKLFIKKHDLSDNKSNIMVSLVNMMDESDEYLDCSRMIFQPSIRINYDGDLPDLYQNIVNEDKLEFIYKDRNIKSRGHMCSALWKEIDYINQFDLDLIWPDGKFLLDTDSLMEFKEPKLRTEFVPIYPMPLPTFDIFDKNSDLLKAESLSKIWSVEDIENELCPLITKYESWIKDNKKNIDEDYSEISSEILSCQETALLRMKDGIKTLKLDKNARLAFCFANKSILTQYLWKNEHKKDFKEFKWRGFQIAFFLMNIESIVNDDSKYKDYLDLLWISTGGGKTEAYLAIMAFTVAYRRLTNKNYGGTSIISRYTLRLLTIQQFNRTLSLITAMEFLRVFKNNDGTIGWRPKNCDFNNDWIYGSLRFSLGLWVGSSVTPNKFLMKSQSQSENDYSALKILKDEFPGDAKSNPAQVVKCPVCGSWLSIPKTGIPEGDSLFLVVKLNDGSLNSLIDKINELPFVKSISNVNTSNHEENYYTLKLIFSEIVKKEEMDIIEDKFNLSQEIASLSIYNPGYFGICQSEGNDKRFSDYEIFCTNPSCKLNSNISWKEGHPFEENLKLDIYYEKIMTSPFKYSTRIPIPAYTIDDQIYSKCPTVLIATVDKIARMAYEGRATSIWGNVSAYNKYYGFLKNDKSTSYPVDALSGNYKYVTKIDNFLPPDLIIQDELHLIDGPLGSMFGVYEAMIDAIIKENGGNPKYIASSATIKNAEYQSKMLFAKKLFQFPPHGLNVENNFFVSEKPLEDAWDEKNSGRIYMGIYAPGRGPMTPQVRLWSNIIRNSLNHDGEKYIKFYWTIVGYYNAIRELGGGVALYREDIMERLKNIVGDNVDYFNNDLELSSRLSSAKIPLELSKIENDGDIEDYEHPKYNAIFTTSMFGTGVDISHLSLMILNGQPKTTGSYIQASGRIGRSHGGLVVDFLKAGRPRDLSHYEMFAAYHHKIQSNVEPVSVSPFSKGSLFKSLSGVIVSFLRNFSTNSNFDWDKEPIPPLDENAENDFNIFIKYLNKRLEFIYDDKKRINELIDEFREVFEKWVDISNDGGDYYYKDTMFHRDVVLGTDYHEYSDKHKAIYRKSPNSLREVEETTMFWV